MQKWMQKEEGGMLGQLVATWCRIERGTLGVFLIESFELIDPQSVLWEHRFSYPELN